ncbi:MAG: DUF799 domain-containing protein [Bacteroidales bacterium]|nr:DUF799 domain-containing protein [Bacteroidales bacterium]MCM1148302.1 DUF799 domain-containing protein [Bacteroidales bacterium]MCM1206506.1 DUF799 domain-containing protein [Bacillota bacterium]MCM1510393.1 DUF799 domain-containing protein [Clostridium sp.]
MKNILITIASVIVLASCSSGLSLEKQYPLMYTERPTSIVIMPPINNTTHVEAKDYFYTTLYAPLCEKGYYVFSPYLTMELFQTESAYDAEMFIDGDLNVFKNVLGADAAMFTKITKWKRNNVGGTISAEVEYILRSTTTGETLYTRKGDIKLDTSVGGGNLLVNLIATAVATATTDKVEAGRACSMYVLSNMPAGKYDTANFDKDRNKPAGKMFLKGAVKKQ